MNSPGPLVHKLRNFAEGGEPFATTAQANK